MNNHIEVNPEICHGKPVIRGTRIMVRNILGAIAGGGYAFYNPSIIQDETTRDKVEGLKAQVIDKTSQAQEQLVSRLPENFQLNNLTQKLPQGAILGEDEVAVESLLSEITNKLKQLPQEKLEQVKADICADVLQASSSASN